MEVIKVVNLAKYFGDAKVLKDINLTVNKGDVISIIGPSGSGKSTFLRCINQLEVPTRGQVWFYDNLIGDFYSGYTRRIFNAKLKAKEQIKLLKKDKNLSKTEKESRTAEILNKRDEKISAAQEKIEESKHTIADNKTMNINEYRSFVNMVFQQFNLFNNLNVLDNCILAQTNVLKRKKD